MAECVVYPIHRSSDIWFYSINVIATPIIFGAGILGNLVCIIVLNTRFIRKSNPAYAYTNGLAILDLLSLLFIVPQYIQDSEALPPEQSHSQIMGYVMNAQRGLSAMCTHSATWFIVMATAVFLARVKTKNYKPTWTKISISRVIAFVIFAASGLLNFPIFFEASVKKVLNHCLEGLELWGLTQTSLGDSILYTSLYPWIVTGVSFLIPYTTLCILCIAVPLKLGIKDFCAKKVVLQNANEEKEKKLQLGKSLFMLIILFIVMETPHNIGKLFTALYGPNFKTSPGYNEFTIISELLGRLRMSLPFIMYALFDGEFRKCLRRVLCCAADEHYEPCACCFSTLPKQDPHFDWSKANGSDNSKQKKKKKRLFKKKKTGSDYSRWV